MGRSQEGYCGNWLADSPVFIEASGHRRVLSGHALSLVVFHLFAPPTRPETAPELASLHDVLLKTKYALALIG